MECLSVQIFEKLEKITNIMNKLKKRKMGDFFDFYYDEPAQSMGMIDVSIMNKYRINIDYNIACKTELCIREICKEEANIILDFILLELSSLDK